MENEFNPIAWTWYTLHVWAFLFLVYVGIYSYLDERKKKRREEEKRKYYLKLFK